eukprot:3757266-Rhodomonas_salina.1
MERLQQQLDSVMARQDHVREDGHETGHGRGHGQGLGLARGYDSPAVGPRGGARGAETRLESAPPGTQASSRTVSSAGGAGRGGAAASASLGSGGDVQTRRDGQPRIGRAGDRVVMMDVSMMGLIEHDRHPRQDAGVRGPLSLKGVAGNVG